MSTGLKEPKRAAAKRDVASHDEGAQSPSLSEAHFPFSGIHDRLTEYREILCRELTQRRADPSSFKGQGIESLLGEVTAQIAQKIETAIAACPPNELSKLKQAISNATLLNGDKLLSGLSFTNRSEDDLRSTSFKEWRARIDGEIRTRLVVGDASEKGIKDSLAGILMSEDLRSMLCGTEGYQWASEIFSQGRMLKAHKLTSATCKKVGVSFKDIKWEACFPGTTEELEDLSKKIRDPRYKGLGGYVAFSDEHADGDMQKGYLLMSALCKFQKVNFASELGWEAAFLGTTGQFETLRKEVSNDSFKGLDGYVAFSKEHANGDMQKGYQLMSALCKYEGVDFEHVLKWPPQFAGTANQYTFIQQSLLEHAEELAALQKVSKDSRLVALHQVLQMIRGGEVIADLPLSALFAALPEKVSTLARGDFSPACLRLVVGVGEAQQTVYFDSAPERICGYLLHRYGLIKSFVEKENLHVRPSQSSRITLDFKVFGRDGEPVFIEYHPLSRSDQAEGINLEEAGRRKKESVTDGAFSEATVHHIWELEQLFSVLGVCDANFAHSFKQFLEDIKEAKALGRKLDQEDKQQLAVVLEGISIKIIGTGSRPLS